jgi:hypothetical protein
MPPTNEQSLPIELQRGMSGYDLERIVFPVWKRAGIWLHRRLSYLHELVCVLKLSTRSFAGHIETLLSKNSYDYSYGLVVEEGPNGVLFWNRRTCARVQGIRELRVRFRWASRIEEQIFLSGFDKGEEFARHLAGTPLVEIPASTWIDPTASSKHKHLT